jgi:hypothetical protein
MINDLFAFLTTEPNAEVGAIHPKAMPCNPDDVCRRGDLDDGAIRRSLEAAAAPSGRDAQNRCPRKIRPNNQYREHDRGR